jgi:hypothetical protein
MPLVSVISEMERMAYGFKWASESEIKCLCPFHEDTSPSCNVNIELLMFKCHAATCGRQGDFVSFMSGYLKQPRAVILADLAKRYGFEVTKCIEASVVEQMHDQIWDARPLLNQLYKRGVTDKMIRRHRLGAKEGRISIPIKNESGSWVNIRYYLPGAPGAEKFKNTRSHSKLRLHPIEQLSYDEILICGGEIKAFVALEELNVHGVGCLSATAGEGAWDRDFTIKLKNKTRVWVCMDIDEGGRKAATKLLAQLYGACRWVGDIVLPLDPDAYPKGDINDYCATERQLLWPLLEACEQWKPKITSELTDDEPSEVDVVAACDSAHAGKRVKLRASVIAMTESPYVIPRTLIPRCERDQNCCALCRVFMEPEREAHTIPSESSAILEMTGEKKSAMREAMMNGIGVPRVCKTVEFDVVDHYTVEDARISPPLDIASRVVDGRPQMAVCVGGGLELNEAYEMTGRMWPHPKTQAAALLISKHDRLQDALTTYEPGEGLEIFQPAAWTPEALHDTLCHIYSDMAANVTRIFNRQDIHLTVDLTYHSSLLLDFDGQKNIKGWAETLIIGDSALGKSGVACGTDGSGGLMKHYGLGQRMDCKNASVAGLLGGCEEIMGKWFVMWGVIPNNDRGLVILDELKGTSIENLGKLTDMRSTGRAEMTKIVRRKTHARTRLCALSNARLDRLIASYSFGGIEAIKDLIGALEDVRRFDMALVVSGADVDITDPNKLAATRPYVEHRFTGDLCRSLVLWAWTRRADQVIFSQATCRSVIEAAVSLCGKFTEAIPLVDRGSMRLKLARLSAALAARTFSTDETRENIVVRNCHVQYVHDFLSRIYSTHTFGYLEYSEAIQLNETLVDVDLIKKRINDTPFPRDFCKQILRAPMVDMADLQDWTGWQRDNANDLLSFFVRKHAIRRAGRNYMKTPPFIELVKHMLENGCLIERPAHIKEEEF